MNDPVNPPSTAFLIASGSVALLAGTGLFARSWSVRRREHPGLPAGRLAPWPISIFEFMFLFAMILLVVALGQGFVALFWGETIRHSGDREGLMMALYGIGFDGFGLLGWPLFRLVRRRMYADYATEPVPEPPARPRASWLHALGSAVTTLLVAVPIIMVVSLAWVELLRLLELPTDSQNAVTAFTTTKSPLVLAGMILVACVLAPLNEEMIFRRGLYHFLREKRVHRNLALVASGVLFGVLHANWASFLPLTLFGVMLALAYEWTGDIRVPILTHALFNSTTVVLLFLGISQ